MTLSLSATEEAGARPVAASDSETIEAKEERPRGFLKATFRDLTAEEAMSPAAFRFLQYEADRLESECNRARTAFDGVAAKHDLATATCGEHRVKIAVLEGRLNRSTENEVLSNLALAGGSALLGAAPSYFSIAGVKTFAIVAMILGAVLVVGSLVARIRS